MLHGETARLLAAFALSLGILRGAAAQPCPTGPPASNYVVQTVPPSFTSILGSPSAVTVFGAGVDDATSPPIPLPISFSFFGVARTSFQVNTNGFLAFDQSLPDGFFANAQLPSAAAPNDLLAGWWDDLHTGLGGSVLYDVSPDGELVVEWNAMEKYPGDGSGENATFQVSLYPSPGNGIECTYDRTTFASGPVLWTASIGAENATGTTGLNATGVGFPGGPTDPLSNHLFPDRDVLLAYELLPPATYGLTASPAAYASITGVSGEVVTWTGPTPTPGDCGACPNATDDAAVTYDLPFPFSYFLTAAVSFTVDSNGFLSINGGGCGSYVNLVPGDSGAQRKIAPFWEDLVHVAPDARTSHLVSGTPGSRQLTVQWENLSPWTPGGGSCVDPGNRLSFQVVLHEGSNAVEFRYGTEVPGAAPISASVGIHGPMGPGYDATGLGVTNASLPTSGYLFDPCECGAMATFGPSCGPRIRSAGGPPVSPNPSFAVVEVSAPPGTLALLYLALSNVYLFGSTPLPISLSAFGYPPGCLVLVDIFVILPGPIVGPDGTALFPAPIPAGLASCAGPVYVQVFNIVPGAPGYGPEILSSNAGTIVH